MTTTLRTARLVLDAWRPDDEDAFVTLLSDPDVDRFMGGPSDAADLRAMFRREQGPDARADWDVWAVREGGAYVGHAELKPRRDGAFDGFELVYALTPAVWGRGLGTELAAAITTHGLEGLGLRAVHATVAPGNAVSLRLLERLGYVALDDLPAEETGEPSRHLIRTAGDGAAGVPDLPA